MPWRSSLARREAGQSSQRSPWRTRFAPRPPAGRGPLDHWTWNHWTLEPLDPGTTGPGTTGPRKVRPPHGARRTQAPGGTPRPVSGTGQTSGPDRGAELRHQWATGTEPSFDRKHPHRQCGAQWNRPSHPRRLPWSARNRTTPESEQRTLSQLSACSLRPFLEKPTAEVEARRPPNGLGIRKSDGPYPDSRKNTSLCVSSGNFPASRAWIALTHDVLGTGPGGTWP